MLDEQHGIQWPFTTEELAGQSQRRLFEAGQFYHPDGRAKFIFESPRDMLEPPTAQYPLLLLTGRASAAQWHTQTRTSKSAVLRKLSTQEIYVEINPLDAKRYRIGPNQRVVVESQRGSIEVKALVTHGVKPGEVFIPMHYDTTNQLTDAVFDPYSKQPSYKACAVRVRRKQDINMVRRPTASAQLEQVVSKSSS
jgi:assimilatory nitrate reductase catalytic subunit